MQVYRKLGDHLPVGTGKEVDMESHFSSFIPAWMKYFKVFLFVFESTFLHQKLSWSIQETFHHSESTARKFKAGYDGRNH